MYKQQKDMITTVYDLLAKKLGVSNWWPGETPLEIVVGAILTQNSAWTNVEKALENLRTHDLLHNPEAMLDLSVEELGQYIRSSGFYTIKSKRLQNTLRFFQTEFDFNWKAVAQENVDDLRPRLLKVKGIGPETADSMLLYAFNLPSFVVDAYTFRIGTRHGFIGEEETYEDVRSMFMQALPEDIALYNEYHALIVRACKEWCVKNKPKCDICPLNILLEN